MKVRRIKPEEMKRVKEFWALAFEYSEDIQKSPKAYFQDAQKDPQGRLDIQWDHFWAAFEDDDSTMMGCMASIPFSIQFDGHHCPMQGIGGVATLPPYRRRGGIRGCFEKALPAMYDEGAVFSYLYPFSTAYYRKFGYELACQRKKYQLMIDKIPYTPLEGTLHLVEPGNFYLEDIRAIYRHWQEDHNMMVIGEDFDFLWVEKSNPFKDVVYTYVYKSQDGTPKAYATFTKKDEASGRNLDCSRFAFTDTEGFRGLMNLFVSLAADHRFVSFYMPDDIPMEPLLPEWSMGGVSCQRELFGMVRVVNVHKAFELARTRGSGHIRLEIKDKQIPQNNGCFAITWTPQGVTEVCPSTEAPDVSMGIEDFSRLIAGVYDVDALPYLDGVTSTLPPETLSGLFYRKPMYISVYF